VRNEEKEINQMDNNEVVLCDFDDKVAYIIGYVTYK
jgi:hypothetical protein